MTEKGAARSIEHALGKLMELWEQRGKPRLMSVEILGGTSRLNLLAHDYVLMSVTRVLPPSHDGKDK